MLSLLMMEFLRGEGVHFSSQGPPSGWPEIAHIYSKSKLLLGDRNDYFGTN